MHEESAKTWLPFKGVALLLKATLPTCVMQASAGETGLTRRPRCARLPSGYEHSSTLAQDSG
jgi:hypothetical protein